MYCRKYLASCEVSRFVKKKCHFETKRIMKKNGSFCNTPFSPESVKCNFFENKLTKIVVSEILSFLCEALSSQLLANIETIHLPVTLL